MAGSRVHFEQAGHHGDRGGLAGTVGPKEAVGLSGIDRETDVVDGHQITERLSQAGTLQDRAITAAHLPSHASDPIDRPWQRGMP